MENVFVTVIIPTYNDWDRLAHCILALKNQSYPVGLFEVIIVNNKEGDTTPVNLVYPENFRIIDERKEGSYASRNTAIRLSKGTILAFTDSDCIPDKDWIKNGVEFLQSNPRYGRIAGRIDLFYNSEKKLTQAELYEKIYAFNQDLYANVYGTSVTANMFTYRSVFDKIGMFDETLMSGGDIEWSERATKAGCTIKYADNVLVLHPARRKMTELIVKSKRVGGGQAQFRGSKKYPRLNALLTFIYDLRPPVRSFPLINKKGADLDLNQKLLILIIRYYLSLITAVEKFRVGFGKQSQRV